MPWSARDTIDPVKNKSLALRQVFAEVANEALERGRTESEAVFAGLAAVSASEKKKAEERKETLKVSKEQQPLHLKLVLDAAKNKQELKTKAQQEVQQITDTSRVVSARFNDSNQLILTFADGAKVISNPLDSTSVVENYISVVQSSGDDAGTTSPVLMSRQSTLSSSYVEYKANLSGLTINIPFSVHGITDLFSASFRLNGEDVSVDWKFSSNKTLLIESNRDLTGVVLIAYGK